MGVCTGINASGVALAQLSAMSRDRTLKGTPAALRFRQALEDGDTVAAVAARVLEAPGTIGNNLMLCGPREALVLEISARQGAVRRPDRGLLTTTNHYQSPAMQGLKGRFPPAPPIPCSPLIISPRPTARPATTGSRSWPQTAAWVPSTYKKFSPTPTSPMPAPRSAPSFTPPTGVLWVAQGETPPVNRGPFVAIKLWD